MLFSQSFDDARDFSPFALTIGILVLSLVFLDFDEGSFGFPSSVLPYDFRPSFGAPSDPVERPRPCKKGGIVIDAGLVATINGSPVAIQELLETSMLRLMTISKTGQAQRSASQFPTLAHSQTLVLSTENH